AANLENLALTGSDAIDGTGNDLNNRIIGNSAANFINGMAGNDTLAGGGGADTFIVQSGNGNDTITDFSHGTDLISLSGHGISSFAQLQALMTQVGSNTVLNFANGETLTLKGINLSKLDAGDFDLSGTAAHHTSQSTAGDTAEDTAQSTPPPSDTVTADNTVVSPEPALPLTYDDTLATHVENYSLTGSATANILGNDLNNRIIGNAGDNVINGADGNDQLNGGTAGSDTLIGGLGNDLYTINHADTTIVEHAGEGSDSVRSAITYTLAGRQPREPGANRFGRNRRHWQRSQ
ncbi:MAG: hypothetical protein P8Y58_18445, partial [Novosphingobium sp.]